MPDPEIRFGEVKSLQGRPVQYGGWVFAPAIVELDGLQDGIKFAESAAIKGVRFPEDADATFVRARLPRIFGYTPEYDETNEKCLLWEGFIAAQNDSAHAFPFVCSDYYGKSQLYFSEKEFDHHSMKRVSAAFWELIAQDPDDLEDFEQGVFHLGACVMMYFGCKNGELFYREDE